MKIDRIQATGLNRLTFDYNLSPLTLIRGANGGGKTSVIDAIILASAGKHPSAPATNPGIMENFASGPSLEVAITTAEGKLSRLWSRTGKTIKGTITGDERIGGSITPALFDGVAFFNANPVTRTNMLRAAFPSAEDPRESIIKVIETTVADAVAPPANWKGLGYEQFIDVWTEAIDVARKAAHQTVTRLKGTIQGITQLDDETITAGSAQTVEEAQAAHVAAVAAHAAASEAHRAAKAAWDAIPVTPEDWEPTRTIEAVAVDLEAARNELASKTAHLANLEQNEKRMKQDMDREQAKYSEALTAHEAAMSQVCLAETAAADYQFHDAEVATAAEISLAPNIEAARTHLEDSRRQKERFQQATLAAQAELTRREQAAASTGCCSQCGAAAAHWAPDHLAKLGLAVAAQKEVLGKNQDNLDLFTLKTDVAFAEWENLKATEARRHAAHVLRAMREKAEALPHPGQSPGLPVFSDLETEQGALYNLECTIDSLVEEHQNLINEDRLKEAMDAMVATEVTLETAATALHEAEITLSTSQAAERLQSKQREAARIQAEAAEALAVAEHEHDAAKQTGVVLKEQAAKESAKVVQPILDYANRFSAGIIDPPLAVAGVSFGRWHGAHWQPINRLSGAERTIIIASLSAALATLGKSKIVIVDELAVIRDDWKAQFLTNLEEALGSGAIEQAIVLDHSGEPRDGWTIIDL